LLPQPLLSTPLRSPPTSTPFPYTTLFRSKQENEAARLAKRRRVQREQEQTARDNAEWRTIAKNVAQRVRDVTVARVLEEIAKVRSEEHTSELQSRFDLVCRLLLEKKKIPYRPPTYPPTVLNLVRSETVRGCQAIAAWFSALTPHPLLRVVHPRPLAVRIRRALLCA